VELLFTDPNSSTNAGFTGTVTLNTNLTFTGGGSLYMFVLN